MEQFEKQINEYLHNDIYNYGFLIKGQWGVGKSHFIKKYIKSNKVPSKFWERILKKSPSEPMKCFIYVSLNGLTKSEDIDIKIIENIILSLPKSPFKIKLKNIRKQINSKNIISLIHKDYTNLTINIVLDFITDIINKKNVVLVFDDLERCKINFNELFAYINQYIEEQEMKVILIANESEIIDEYKEEYFKIKEKFIGHTIEFLPDIKENYLLYVKKNPSVQLKNILIHNADNLVTELNNQNHLNMRTMQFIIDKFVNFYNIVLENSEFANDDTITENIFKYIAFTSIIYKKGGNLYDNWKNMEYGYINLKEDIVSTNYRMGFKFIDSYILNGFLDSKSILRILSQYKKGMSSKNGPYNTLRNNYWEMEDNEVYKFVNEIKEQFEKNIYNSNNILDCLILLLKLEDCNYNINIEQFIELFKDVIENDTTNDCLYFSSHLVDFSKTSKIVKDKYFKIVEILKKHVSKFQFKKIEDLIENHNFKMLFEKITSDQNMFNFIITNGFFNNINIEKLVTNIEKTEKVIELMYFKYFCDKLIGDIRYIEIFNKEIEHAKLFISKLKEINIKNNIGKSRAIHVISDNIELYEKNYSLKKKNK